jgi:hypothetical protein
VLHELGNLVFQLQVEGIKAKVTHGSELFLTRNVLGFLDKCFFALNPEIKIKCNQAVFTDASEKKIGQESKSQVTLAIWTKQPDLVVFKDGFPIIFEEDKAAIIPQMILTEPSNLLKVLSIFSAEQFP